METLRFKTSLKCGGCISAVKPGLDGIKSINKWSVDLMSADKVLEIESTEDISDEVIESVKKTGYLISRL